MSKNTHLERAEQFSLPVPAGTKSGAALRVGGLNVVTETAVGEGGNVAGEASCKAVGSYFLTVTGAVTPGAPVYISGTNTLSTTNTDPLFGHALATKGAAAGDVPVRISN